VQSSVEQVVEHSSPAEPQLSPLPPGAAKAVEAARRVRMTLENIVIDVVGVVFV